MHEIDIIALVKKVLKERVLLFKWVLSGAIIGIIIALSIPKQYTASVVLAPEMGSSGAGLSESLSDMASQFGFDLGSKSGVDAIYPEIYPDIFSSTDFVETLLDIPVCMKGENSNIKFKQYLTSYQKIPFWNYPKVWISKSLQKNETSVINNSSNIYIIPKTDFNICETIKKSISCVVDKKTNVITIAVSAQDPLVAAIIVDTLQLRLQEYITKYRTKKAYDNYDFYVKMEKSAEKDYTLAAKEYTNFCESNNEIMIESLIAKRDELENNMQLAYNQLNQLRLQIQKAQMDIQERTPAFTIIASSKMPYKASSMPRSVIVIIFIMLAVAADAIWIGFIRKNKK